MVIRKRWSLFVQHCFSIGIELNINRRLPTTGSLGWIVRSIYDDRWMF
jgi:hypothetical protein